MYESLHESTRRRQVSASTGYSTGVDTIVVLRPAPKRCSSSCGCCRYSSQSNWPASGLPAHSVREGVGDRPWLRDIHQCQSRGDGVSSGPENSSDRTFLETSNLRENVRHRSGTLDGRCAEARSRRSRSGRTPYDSCPDCRGAKAGAGVDTKKSVNRCLSHAAQATHSSQSIQPIRTLRLAVS